ncbi:MAG: hypothetical protein LBU62_02325, partial [Bacteroidales bacterium]|nr:hypothetical protein [Bacteroidales bacterium]
MKKFKNVFLAAMAVLSVILTGCDKDKENIDPTTVAEDKANIQASFNRVENLLQNFRNGTLYSFGDQFLDIHEEYIEEDYWSYYYVGEGQGHYTYDEDYNFIYKSGGEWERYTYGYYDDVVSDFVELLGDKLGDVVDFNSIDDNRRFNFQSFAGKYEWN